MNWISSIIIVLVSTTFPCSCWNQIRKQYWTKWKCEYFIALKICVGTCFFVNTITFQRKTHNLSNEELEKRIIDFVDICKDQLPEHKYKESEDPRRVKLEKKNIGPLVDGWQTSAKSVMCAYKVVRTKFEIWGLQTRAESYMQRVWHHLKRLWFFLLGINSVFFKKSPSVIFYYWLTGRLTFGQTIGLNCPTSQYWTTSVKLMRKPTWR